ncbi:MULTISPECIES: STM2901 family protein [Burkholderia]|uniref:STM2901 family protein n=1 Tax=Burkholderia TaxID=32008 RepID=UPI000BBD2AE2|nr:MULTISPECIES: hypothetical protein [Burkholderia]ATF84801.1 hypothetical protein CO712_06895 [Burkholderia gladioli pv. gladioli]AYQ87977.1 hypothetical protein EDD84_11680 [Burkholderia gladioli]MBJ9661403.1 hypothetical protein [Burkholderia gladioli]MBJ9715108.1 hypothetical protein [Burkholderia gladioli]MBU9154162.1 hypothetical protein [Burkholderia gladioli]
MSENRYTYDHRQNLSPPEVFVWIALNETRKQLGLDDLASAAAILLGQNDVPVSGKVGGAVEGTSVASLAARKLLPFRLARRLPTLTKGGALGVRIAMTRSAGAFVGRAVPVVGTVLLARDVFLIMERSVSTYNHIVKPEDRVL